MTERTGMRSRSWLAPCLCLCCCLCFTSRVRAAPESARATFWIRGVQQLSFAGDSGRRAFAATVGLNLPWEFLLAQTLAVPPASSEPSNTHDSSERATTHATAPPAQGQDDVQALRSPASAVRERTGSGAEAAPPAALTPLLVRATLMRAYRAQGADAADTRLESLDARSRWSAALPELRLRAARATDESQRLAPTVDDPYRYTRDGGTDLAFEVRLTWHLSGLVFSAPEVSVERLRSERAQRRAELRREVLKLLFAWQRARLVVADPDALDEERQAAALTRLEAELTLNALTGGWFDESRPQQVESSRSRAR